MNPEKYLNNIIPNPLNNKSALEDAEKKAELFGESLTIAAVFRNGIFLLSVVLFSTVYLKLPTTPILILVSVEILVNGLSVVISSRKIASINKINPARDVNSYRNLIINSGFYDLVKSIAGLIANVLSLSTVLLLFKNEISSLEINLSNINFVKVSDLLYIFVIFRVVEIVTNLIKYVWTNNVTITNNFAQLNQEYQLIKKKIDLVKNYPSAGMLLYILNYLGLPLYITILFGIFMLLIIILSTVEINRIRKVNFDQSDDIITFNKVALKKYEDEQVEETIFGIIKSSTHWKDTLKPIGSAFLGTGRNLYPENAMLVTNHRLLLLQIPMPGNDKIVGNVDFVTSNFLFNRAQIEEKGQEIINKNSMQEILKFAIKDVLYEDILSISVKEHQIIIEKRLGEKLAYSFLDKGFSEILIQALSIHLKEKLIVN